MTLRHTVLPAFLAFAMMATAQTPPTTPAIPGVVAAGTKMEVVQADGFPSTEGPIALPDGSLYFSEPGANTVRHIGLDGKITLVLENTGGANGLGFDSKRRLIAAQGAKSAVGVIAPSDQVKVLSASTPERKIERPNDLVVDKKDGIYFSDIPKPAIYYIKPSGETILASTDVSRPNGVLLSRDEKILYVTDTWGDYVVAFDVQPDGTLKNRRNFAQLKPVTEAERQRMTGENTPQLCRQSMSCADGMAIDKDGRLYVTSYAGVQVFSPKGEHLGTIPFPKKPQNVAFAGKDKKTLYIVGRGTILKLNTLTQGYTGRPK